MPFLCRGAVSRGFKPPSPCIAYLMACAFTSFAHGYMPKLSGIFLSVLRALSCIIPYTALTEVRARYKHLLLTLYAISSSRKPECTAAFAAFVPNLQGLLEELSNVYDVSVSAVQKSGGNSSADSYVNATLWTIVFNDPVGDVPGLEVCIHDDMTGCPTVFTLFLYYVR